jgi:hypothetical protein
VTPPAGETSICTDELGPVVPRTFPPARGWSVDGHRIKAPLAYERGRDADLDLWCFAGAAREGADPLCARAHLQRVHRPLGRQRSGPSKWGRVPDHRHPLQSHQPGDADPYRGPSTPAPRVHSDGGLLAQFAGGLLRDSFATRRSPGRALPTPRRSTRRGESPPNRSTAARIPGCGDAHPRPRAGAGTFFVIVFNEQSISYSLEPSLHKEDWRITDGSAIVLMRTSPLGMSGFLPSKEANFTLSR